MTYRWGLAMVLLLAGCSFDGGGVGGRSLDGGGGPGADGSAPAPDASAGNPADGGPDSNGNGDGNGNGNSDGNGNGNGNSDGNGTRGDNDSDGDSVFDPNDNCPAVPNPTQHDEDGDGVGDACDNCPAAANADQADDQELLAGAAADGVGDRCDPRPSAPGDAIAFFDGFGGSALEPGWSTSQGLGFHFDVSGDRLEVGGGGGGERILYRAGLDLDRAVVETVLRFDEAPPKSLSQGAGAGLLAAYSAGFSDSGYSCAVIVRFGDDHDHHKDKKLSGALGLLHLGFTTDPLDVSDLGGKVDLGTSYRVLAGLDGPKESQRCHARSLRGATSASAFDEDDREEGGSVGVYSWGTGASFTYVLIYSLGGPLD